MVLATMTDKNLSSTPRNLRGERANSHNLSSESHIFPTQCMWKIMYKINM